MGRREKVAERGRRIMQRMTEEISMKVSKQSVLWIEDDTSFLRELLQVWAPNFTMRHARSTPEALELLEKETPALILLDLGLPCYLATTDNEEGFALLAAIRKELKLDVPVVVVTRQTDLECRDRAFRTGANAYLAKPVKLDELEAVIVSVRALAKGDRS